MTMVSPAPSTPRAAHIRTPLGPLAAMLDGEDFLVAILHGEAALAHPAASAADSPGMRRALHAIEAYLRGDGAPLEALPHRFEGGTELQRATWRALRDVPRGETINYAQLAKRLGRAKAVRAVGGACGRNPLPLLYPCHRIVGSDGSLTGFAWGLDAKRRLLALEKTAAA